MGADVNLKADPLWSIGQQDESLSNQIKRSKGHQKFMGLRPWAVSTLGT